jgi:hypothetical protein
MSIHTPTVNSPAVPDDGQGGPTAMAAVGYLARYQPPTRGLFVTEFSSETSHGIARPTEPIQPPASSPATSPGLCVVSASGGDFVSRGRRQRHRHDPIEPKG